MLQKPKLVWKGQAAISRMRAASARGVEKAGRLYIQEVLRLIFDTPKTGQVYNGHQASAPGEPIASETGTYVNRFKIEVKQLKAGPVCRVSNTAPHAKLVEFGTSRMDARPTMRPALLTAGPGVFKTVRNEWVAEFKRK